MAPTTHRLPRNRLWGCFYDSATLYVWYALIPPLSIVTSVSDIPIQPAGWSPSQSLWPPSSVERKRELFSIIKLTLWVKVYDRDIVSGPKSKWRPIRMRWIRAAPGSGCQGEQWMLYVRRRRGVDDACVHCKINYIACVSILGPTVHSHILQRSHPLAYASFVPPYFPNFIVCEIAQHATFYIIDAVLH